MESSANIRPRLLVAGTAAVDLTARVTALPCPGETLSLREVTSSPGGKALNVALAARRLGMEVGLVARVGTDSQGGLLSRALEQEGVDTRFLEFDRRHPTALSIVCVDPQGENMILTLLGAAAQLEGSSAVETFPADVWVCQPEFELEALARLLTRSRAPVVLSLAPYRQLSKAILNRIDTVVVNQAECAALLGIWPATAGQIVTAHEKLGGHPALVVTLGTRGSVLVEEARVLHLPARAVSAVSTVGAGDGLVAGFALGIARGGTRLEALRLGSEVAARVVQGHRADDIPRLEALWVTRHQNARAVRVLEPDQRLELL